MGLFSRKYSISDLRLLDGATDHHSHILPGVDDGVRTEEESLAILSLLEDAGLKSLWLTPHTMEDVPNTTDTLKRRFDEFLKVYDGPIELHLSSEYMMDELFEKHLEEKDFLCHREEGSVLMETSTWSGPYNFWDLIDRTMRSGFRPVLAHPERYDYMDDGDYERLHGMGVRLQLNYPSLLGFYGGRVRAKALHILKEGWYDMAGSDCHRLRPIAHTLSAKVLKKDEAELLRRILTA